MANHVTAENVTVENAIGGSGGNRAMGVNFDYVNLLQPPRLVNDEVFHLESFTPDVLEQSSAEVSLQEDVGNIDFDKNLAVDVARPESTKSANQKVSNSGPPSSISRSSSSNSCKSLGAVDAEQQQRRETHDHSFQQQPSQKSLCRRPAQQREILKNQLCETPNFNMHGITEVEQISADNVIERSSSSSVDTPVLFDQDDFYNQENLNGLNSCISMVSSEASCLLPHKLKLDSSFVGGIAGGASIGGMSCNTAGGRGSSAGMCCITPTVEEESTKMLGTTTEMNCSSSSQNEQSTCVYTPFTPAACSTVKTEHCMKNNLHAAGGILYLPNPTPTTSQLGMDNSSLNQPESTTSTQFNGNKHNYLLNLDKTCSTVMPTPCSTSTCQTRPGSKLSAWAGSAAPTASCRAASNNSKQSVENNSSNSQNDENGSSCFSQDKEITEKSTKSDLSCEEDSKSKILSASSRMASPIQEQKGVHVVQRKNAAQRSEAKKRQNKEQYEYSFELCDFVENCLQLDPKDRLDIFELQAHPFLLKAFQTTQDEVAKFLQDMNN